jgi:DNA-entry nuclease
MVYLNGGKNMKKRSKLFVFILLLGVLFYFKEDIYNYTYSIINTSNESYDIENLPEYDGNSYVIVNDNIPYFKEEEYTTTSFEKYSELDSLGRCGVASANISKDLMPTEKRGSIGMIKPSGWHTIKYDHIDGKYLYNRCHLIGYQLTGENANEKNLITCTRSMNAKGMLQFENMVTKYIKDTGNHVLYRVTPVFEGNNLVATGVEMEAYSVEDNGKGIKFNVFVYNIEDGIIIDYKTGDSKLAN